MQIAEIFSYGCKTHQLIALFYPLYLQSLLDFAVSIILLLTTLSITDSEALRNTGLIASIECRLWNTQFLLWGLFLCSTWNIVVLTFER